MALVTEIMDEIAATLDDVLGVGALGDEAFSIDARLNLSPSIPAIDIYPDYPFITSESAGFGGTSDALNFVVRARVNGDEKGRQDLLLTLMDPEHENCVTTALEDDQTLNGLVSSVEVDVGPSGYVQYSDAGGAASHIGCEWRVKVLQVIT